MLHDGRAVTSLSGTLAGGRRVMNMTSLWLQNPTTIPTDTFHNGAHYNEIVVGAGITGLVAALLLARAGKKVAVLESRTVGAGATGNTTAKFSLLQGTHLSKVLSHNYPAVLRAYAEGNREALDWVLEYALAHNITVERKTAYTYAASAEGNAAAQHEYSVARMAGLDVEWVREAPLPFATYGAVRLADQAQLDPMDLLAALAADIRLLGGVIVEGARVTGVKASSPARVATVLGDVTADHVTLATGVPILDRGLYFAKVSARRSYAQAYDVPASDLVDGMFLGVESPTRSIRTWKGQLLTGGNGHPVGREPSPRSRARELTEWTTTSWPQATLTNSWSAQDYSAAHHVPFVGWMPRGRGRIYLATGFDKWGMTNGIATALTIVNDLLGEDTDWQKTLHHRVTMPAAIGRGIGENAAVAWWYAKGYAWALTTAVPAAPPGEGESVVGRVGLRPTAVSTVDGATCAVSAMCGHLGAVVTWNDQERSWDCPAHGSRFTPDGTVIEGPARRGLRRL